MVIHWPKGIKAKGEVRSQFHHVIDVAPTILEAAHLPEPKIVNGTPQAPIEGVSMAYTFDDAKAKDRHTTQYFEIFGNRALYHDGWLAGTVHKAPWEAKPRHVLQEDAWELYNVAEDFSLTNDLATKNPQKLKELQDLFMSEAAKYSVLPIDDRVIERLIPAVAGRPDLMGDRKSLTLYEGMQGMLENVFINVKNRSVTITADVEIQRRGQRGPPLPGWAFWRVEPLYEGRQGGLRLQLPRPAALHHPVRQTPAGGLIHHQVRFRLRRRKIVAPAARVPSTSTGRKRERAVSRRPSRTSSRRTRRPTWATTKGRRLARITKSATTSSPARFGRSSSRSNEFAATEGRATLSSPCLTFCDIVPAPASQFQGDEVLKTTLLVLAAALASCAEETAAPPPDQALRMLLDGNKQYVTFHLRHPHETSAWRHGLTKAQHPYATILTCSDSRVPPELLFDAGLGDLFVIRVAGNVAADAVIGSIEYAVEHLGTRLVLVMGHESCGAVQATIGGGEPETHIQSLTRPIEPAVARARNMQGDLVANAVSENVRIVVDQLQKSKPILADRVENGTYQRRRCGL